MPSYPLNVVPSYPQNDIFQPGTVVCLEPWLYYPDDPRGRWGVRIQDDYWFDMDGKLQQLAHLIYCNGK